MQFRLYLPREERGVRRTVVEAPHDFSWVACGLPALCGLLPGWVPTDSASLVPTVTVRSGLGNRCSRIQPNDLSNDLAAVRQAPLWFGWVGGQSRHPGGKNELRQPPQPNYPPDTVPDPDSRAAVRILTRRGWYSKVDSPTASAAGSKSPTYPLHVTSKSNAKV